MIPQFFIRLNRMLQSFEPSTGNVGNRMLRRLYILIIAISSRIQPSSRQQFRILTLWTVLIIKNNAGISMNHMAHCYGGGYSFFQQQSNAVLAVFDWSQTQTLYFFSIFFHGCFFHSGRQSCWFNRLHVRSSDFIYMLKASSSPPVSTAWKRWKLQS